MAKNNWTREETIIAAAILQDEREYGESCKKKENKTASDDFIFLKIKNKNPSESLLEQLNKGQEKYYPANSGVMNFKKGLLMGFKSKNNQEQGYLITISNIGFDNSSTAFVSFSQLKASLNGADKTYHLGKTNSSNWEITGCEVHGYN